MKLQWHDPILTIHHSSWTTVDEIFSYFHISRKNRYLYYQQERIHLNHQPIKKNTSIQEADRIDIHTLCEEIEESCIPCFNELSLLFEDDLFLIVDKPSGMLVHSDGTSTQTTLYDLVKGYYIQNGIHCPVRAIHRLDYNTSGAVIFCKIPFLQSLLDTMLKDKEIERRYTTLCAGRIQKQQFSLNAPIGRDRHHASRMRISTSGKSAQTDFTVIKRYADFTCLECKLHQGRTHQIRVHLASIEHPILHDVLYGNTDTRIMRSALHAHQVVLFHPLLQKQITVNCPLPEDMKRLL